MLPKKHKIDKHLFQSVIKEGKFLNSPYFTLRYTYKNKEPLTKVSFSVSKKISKSAIVRNKIKRKCYNATKIFLKDIKPSFLLSFFVKKEALDASFDELREDIYLLIKKAGAL